MEEQQKHQQPAPLRVVALHHYEPQNEDELAFRKGDIIIVTEKDKGTQSEMHPFSSAGWWKGILNKKEGLFPSNYVSPLDPSDDLGSDTSPKYAKALFDYSAKYADELSFAKGEIFHIVQRNAQGWIRGYIHGQKKKGFIPENFVEILTEQEAKQEILNRKKEKKQKKVAEKKQKEARRGKKKHPVSRLREERRKKVLLPSATRRQGIGRQETLRQPASRKELVETLYRMDGESIENKSEGKDLSALEVKETSVTQPLLDKQPEAKHQCCTCAIL